MKIIITEEQLKNILLTEKVSDKVYHQTTVNGLENILKTNKIFLTPSYGISADKSINYNKLYSLSLTTARNTVTGYRGTGKNNDYAKGRVRLELDGRELNYNYKSKHVDYWQYPRKKEITMNSTIYDEMEERILSDKNEITPAARYINAIEIYIEERAIEKYKQIKSMADQLNIPCYFYDNARDFNFSLKENSIDISTLTGENIEDKYKDDYTKQRSVIDIEKIVSLICFKDENIKNNVFKYAEENGIDLNFLEEKINKQNERFNQVLNWPSFNDYHFQEMTIGLNNEIQNNRSSQDEFVRYVIKLFGYEMKKRKIDNIKDYLIYKTFIGRKTLNDYKKVLYQKIVHIIDNEYKIQLEDLDRYSFTTVDGEYYSGNVTKEFRSIKYELDKIIYKIKEYYKNIIEKNDGVFKNYFEFGKERVIDALKLNEINYEFESEYLDYSNSDLSTYEIRRVIDYVLYEIDHAYYDLLEKIKEDYYNQFRQ